MIFRRGCALASALVGALACTPDGAKSTPKPAATVAVTPVASIPDLALTVFDLGAQAGSVSPRLQRGAEGSVSASWLEPVGDGHRLRWRRLGSEGPTGTVTEGADLLQNWADTPAVAILGPVTRVAMWPALHPQRQPSEGVAGYGLRWSRFVAAAQGAGTWGDPAALSSDVRGPEYGFVSIAPLREGSATVFWLDGRASEGHHGGQMQLRTATVTAAGIEDRRLVDDRVCDCCQTSAAATARGPVVAYRDRSDDEVRDIWLAGPGVEQRRRVGQDDWRIEGCPVNGPAVSVREDTVAVAWFRAVDDAPQVHVAFATGDAVFGQPVRVDDGQPVGRVDLVWIARDQVAVSWIEKTGPTAAEIRVRVVDSAGARGPAMRVASTTPDRRSGFPQLERGADDTLVWAWTDAPEGMRTQVRFGRAAVASLETPPQ